MRVILYVSIVLIFTISVHTMFTLVYDIFYESAVLKTIKENVKQECLR